MVYSTAEPLLTWFDRPLMKSPEVGIAIVGVGALVPGYVLVAPARHCRSVQALFQPSIRQFMGFFEQVRKRVENRFGPTTVFEHGSCLGTTRCRAACITHAHLHIVPGSYNLESLGLDARTYATLTDTLTASEHERFDGYLLYQEPGGNVRYAPDPGISQFFRRHIARRLGTPDEWDYALFPHFGRIRATIDGLDSSPPPIT